MGQKEIIYIYIYIYVTELLYFMKQGSVGFDLVIMWSETCAWNREKSPTADMGQRF